MTRLRIALFAALAVATAAPAAAQTIRARSTTLILSRQDAYLGDLEEVLPIFELLSITASDISTPYAQDVEVALSTWGAVDLADVRSWQNGTFTDRRLTGDVDVGYVKGELLGRRLIVRLGRQMISEGAARMVHLDGGQLRLRLPGGFGFSAYAGSPVASRFGSRGGVAAVGNHRANLATGGRLSWFLPGTLELGASTAIANDRGEPSRRDAGADLRIFLPADLELAGSGFYSLYDERLGEADVSLSWRGSRKVQVAADYRHVEPDLFLPRTSILSVFADDQRNDVGGWIHLEPVRSVELDADYHALFEDDGTGHRSRAKGVWSPRQRIDLGAETVWLTHEDDNGYWLARGFGAYGLGDLDLTLDLLSYFLERDVNGEDLSLTATGTVGWRFGGGWKVLVAGTGGTTPLLERHFDVMAKLVYDQTYVAGEVR